MSDNVESDPLSYPTVITMSGEAALEWLSKLREARLKLDERTNAVEKAIRGIKHGSARTSLEKRLQTIVKKLERIDRLCNECDAALNENFGA